MVYSSSASFAIYIRKSTEQSDRQVLSIESQIEELQSFASQQGLSIFQIFTDAASAHKTNNRPAFDQLMIAIQQKKLMEF